jgi:O-antigen/teichoic acid export membrane protein
MFGATMLLSGDLTGVAVILGAAITGVAALVGTVLFRRLSRMDEQAIMSALRAIADDAQLT